MQTPKFNSQPIPSTATTPKFPTGQSKALIWSLAIIRVIG